MRHRMLFISILFTISFASAQSFNQQQNTSGGQSVLLGKINKEGLSESAFSSWFITNYDAYSPKEEPTNQLKKELSGYTITAFMGTWCGDSKREVPKFYKVLEEAQFLLDRLTMVAVSRDRDTYKQSPGGEEEGLNVHRVPTFIIYKDGKEVNRIVESPVISLEEDMLHILQQNYVPNYETVQRVAANLNDMGVVKFEKKIKKLAKQLKPITKTMHELNTFSNVLFTAQKKEEAIAVARLNLLLFPEDENAQKTMDARLK
jgi:thiol-disulfide isomerase/thioredoxin